MFVESEGERFEKGNVVGHNLLVAEVEFVYDDGVDVVIGEQIICQESINTKLFPFQTTSLTD